MKPDGKPPPSSGPTLPGVLARVDELGRRGDFGAALALIDEAVRSNPARPDLLYRRATLLLAMRRQSMAAAAFRDVLRLAPRSAQALNGLGSALASTGELGEAAAVFRQACELEPQRVDHWLNLARAQVAAGDLHGACATYGQVLRLRPEDLDAGVAHAKCLAALGRLDEAAAGFRAALRSSPNSVSAWAGLVGLKSTHLDAAELAQLGELHERTDERDPQRAALGFALGQALEAAGRYRQAFDVLVESNAARARSVRWQPAELATYVEGMISIFRSGLAQAPDHDLGRGVIFLVGMPRCGSTLVEQVLAAHPEVEGAGELVDVHAVLSDESARRGRPLVEWVADAGPDDWAALGRTYLDRTARWRRSHAVFTDKQLDNWRHVGILHAMLPGARFIHCRRDPVETCWSCFKHDFYRGQAAFTYEFDHLARYWQDSTRLARFWNERYPGLVFEHVHEDFVEQPEAGVRRLLHHCGLTFHEACLRFHEADRVVRTASSGQVRRPISRDTAVASRYGGLLDPLRAALGAGPAPA